MQNLCMPCEKGNCDNCLYEVVDVTVSEVVPCSCPCNTDDECESCGFAVDRPMCDHGRLLCVGCSNECRPCEEIKAQDERTDRVITEQRERAR
jgi:hypothetical protein